MRLSLGETNLGGGSLNFLEIGHQFQEISRLWVAVGA